MVTVEREPEDPVRLQRCGDGERPSQPAEQEEGRDVLERQQGSGWPRRERRTGAGLAVEQECEGAANGEGSSNRAPLRRAASEGPHGEAEGRPSDRMPPSACCRQAVEQGRRPAPWPGPLLPAAPAREVRQQAEETARTQQQRQRDDAARGELVERGHRGPVARPRLGLVTMQRQRVRPDLRPEVRLAAQLLPLPELPGGRARQARVRIQSSRGQTFVDAEQPHRGVRRGRTRRVLDLIEDVRGDHRRQQEEGGEDEHERELRDARREAGEADGAGQQDEAPHREHGEEAHGRRRQRDQGVHGRQPRGVQEPDRHQRHPHHREPERGNQVDGGRQCEHEQGERGHLGAEQAGRRNRQRPEDGEIAGVERQGVPLQGGRQRGEQHRGRDELVLVSQRHEQPFARREERPRIRQRQEGEGEGTRRGQRRGRRRGVDLRVAVPRQEVVLEEPAGEETQENPEGTAVTSLAGEAGSRGLQVAEVEVGHRCLHQV